MRSKLISLFLTFLASLTLAENGGNEWPYANFTEGLTFAVGADKWTEFKNANWEYFQDVVMLMNLTDIEMSGNLGYIRENTYNVTSTANQAAMRLVPEDNGVVVTADNIEAIFISESSRIRKGFLTLSGHCESTSHNMSLNNELIWSSIPAADFNTTGRRLMGITTRYSIIRIDRSEIDFKFEGNLLADIANVFHDSVLPIVMSEVEEALAININTNLPVAVNALFRMDDAYLQLFPPNGTMPKYEDFRIDFSVNNNPQVTEKYIGFSVKALWFNIIQGYRELPVDRAEPLPMWTDKYD